MRSRSIPRWRFPSQAVLSEDDWVEANARLVEELGSVAYLRNLLTILKGGFTSGEVGSDLPFGFGGVAAVIAEFEDEDEDEDEEEVYEEDDALGGPHAMIDADLLDGYVTGRLFDRLESEPGFLPRSIAVLMDTELDDEIADELEEIESDPDVLFDVLRASRGIWEELDPEARRLLIIYALDKVVIDDPSAPIEEMVDIHWRIAPPV